MAYLKLLGVVALLSLVGCATNKGMSSAQKNAAYAEYLVNSKLETVHKINSFGMRSWQPLTDEYLIVSTSPKKKYLIDVGGHCSNLSSAYTIGFKQSSSAVLSAKFDSILVLDRHGGMRPEKCIIRSIYPISKQQAKEIVAIGKPVKEA